MSPQSNHSRIGKQEEGSDEQTPLLNTTASESSNSDRNHWKGETLNAVLSNTTAGLEPDSPELYSVLSHASTNRPNVVRDDEEDGDENDSSLPKDDQFLTGISAARFWLIYGTVLPIYFIAMFDSTLMASAHPVITSYFKSSNSASWLSTVFLLTQTTFQPLFGRISDTIGRRPLYIFALFMFALTTAWCALAPSIGSFIAARAFAGLGAGGGMAMGAIITNDLVPIERRGTFQAYINLSFGLGAACGAAFGGFLCDHIGWRWTFGIQTPPIILVLIGALFCIPSNLGPNLAKNSDKSAWQIIRSFDFAGSFSLSLTVAFLILGLNLGGNILSWTHPFIITSLVISFLGGILFLRIESKATTPVIPLQMLFSRPRGHLVFANFFAQLGNNTILFNAPLYFQAVKLDSPSVSGFRLGLASIAVTIAGVSSGFIMMWSKRMTPLLIIGSLFALLGPILLTLMWGHIPSWLATLFLVPHSIGQGLSFPAVSLAVLVVSSQAEQAVMTSTLTLGRSLGIVLGVAVSSLIVQNALVGYLGMYVTGVDKDEVIAHVRKSVHYISRLVPERREEVIHAYEDALRMTFMSAIVEMAIALGLVLSIKLPKIERR
ncbi:MFS general substrate transporter [Patellaria atrata CBS 101060]|uniref:MFS general substrate transporter n=1 Tax=Patellaria atrata CBS 101060 TaxID=1346257 RepID=A0A9P4VQZ4_9PEZI|nr:MFS general substrate transporter [Patellaria atrata CBS 101060]